MKTIAETLTESDKQFVANVRRELALIAARIRKHQKVYDEDCVCLHSLVWIWDCPAGGVWPITDGAQKLRNQIGVVWTSSRCANWDIIALTLELLSQQKDS